MTPTAASLDLLRRSGFLCEVVERWLPKVNVRRDLFHERDGIGCVLVGVTAAERQDADLPMRGRERQPAGRLCAVAL